MQDDGKVPFQGSYFAVSEIRHRDTEKGQEQRIKEWTESVCRLDKTRIKMQKDERNFNRKNMYIYIFQNEFKCQSKNVKNKIRQIYMRRK